VVQDLPPGFDNWWVRASSRDPNGRFQGAKEFGEALQLVLGMSQLTDVMDRNQLKGVLGVTPNPAGPPVPMRTPAAYGATTPAPGMIAAAKFAATTGAGVAHGATGDEAVTIPGAPKRGLGIAIAGVASLVAVGLVIGGVVVMRGHGGAPSTAAASQPASGPVLATAPAPQAAATPPPAVPVAQPAALPTAPTTPAAVEPPPGATTPAAAVATDPSHHTHHGGGASPAPKPAAATPAKPAASKSSSQDMGF
jgi:serine/threonine-protein kinase